MGQQAVSSQSQSSQMGSWREAAGRPSGPDGYVFGDVSRSTLRRLSASMDGIDWKAASGREVGSEGYVFGDITRAGCHTFSTGLNWQSASGRTSGPSTYQFGDVTRSLVSLVWSCARDNSEKFDGGINEVWTSFFLQCEECGKAALASGLISFEDVAAQEPYLFLGLPGLCILECVLRSLPPKASPNALVLADGREISPDSVPVGDGAPELFAALLHAKHAVVEAKLDGDRVNRLRIAVLRAEGDEGGEVEVSRLASVFQQIATDISQLPFYRMQFLSVLEELSAQN